MPALSDPVTSRTYDSYDDWVDQVNEFNAEYFESEDISELNFDWFYDKYLELDPQANQTYKADVKAHMKRVFMSVEHVSLSDLLQAEPLLHEDGRNALRALKQGILYLQNTSATYSTIQSYLQTTAEDATEDESLTVPEQAMVFLACVGMEAALNPALEWSNIGRPGDPVSQNRFTCDFKSIAHDFIIFSAVGAVGAIVAGIATGGIALDLESLTLSAILQLASPVVPYILGAAAVASILINCWEIIADFFEDLWDNLRDYFSWVFGGGNEDCDDVNDIFALALDCGGDVVRFTAADAGADIVAYSWNNTNTSPQIIVTQHNSFSFEPTGDAVTIRVTPICSEPGTGLNQTQENFDISDLIDNAEATTVQFVDWPSSPNTNQTYRFYLFTGAGTNETLDWSVGTGVTIQTEGPYWIDVLFYISGNRSVTATITNTCNADFSTDTKTVFVN